MDWLIVLTLFGSFIVLLAFAVTGIVCNRDLDVADHSDVSAIRSNDCRGFTENGDSTGQFLTAGDPVLYSGR